MPSPEKLDPTDAVLLRYLLGALPVDEAEPIEEASIVDDDLAARLNVMERDLVDSYVRRELEGSNLAKFQSWYLSSPLRVQKVEAAKAILTIADGVTEVAPTNVAPAVAAPPAPKVQAPAPISAPAVRDEPSPARSVAPPLSYGATSAGRKPTAGRFGKLGTWPVLGFAAAVLVLIVAVGFLTNKNKELRKEVAETKKSAPIGAPSGDQHTAENAPTGAQGGTLAGPAHGAENVATVTLFLPAPTRGASAMPKVNVPAGTGLIVLSLGLGSTDEDNYRAQLMNPTTQKIIWRSGLLRPGSDGTFVSVAVPANVVRSQIYLIQLMHDAANGKPELLGTYPFRVEVK